MEKIQTLYTDYKKILQERRPLAWLLLFFFGLVLAIPFIWMADAGVLRSFDYAIDDKLFQGSISASSEIVLLTVEAEDLSQQDTEALAAQLVTRLNRDADNAPAVIGLDLDLKLEVSSQEAMVLSWASNVVLGSKVGIDTEVFVGDNDRLSAPLVTSRLMPAAMLGQDAVGHTSVVADQDGHLRHYLWSTTDEDGQPVPSFAQLCYTRYCQATGQAIKSPRVSRDGLCYVLSVSSRNSYTTYSVSDVLNGTVESSALAGKLVLVGICDTALTDVYSAAQQGKSLTYPVEFQANMVNDLLRNVRVQEMPVFVQLGCLWILFAALFALLFTLPTSRFLLVLLGSSLLELGCGGIFCCMGYLIHFSFIIFHILIMLLAVLIFRLLRINQQQRSTQAVLQRYIDAAVSTDLLNGSPEDSLKIRHKQWVAILFADIRGFTSFSETATPEQLVSLLNQYFSVVSACVHENGGTLDKYIGDCVMAIWGAPKAVENPAYSACKAALEINSRIRQLIPEIEELAGHALYFGIGIHYGDAVVGNVGAVDRMDYTAIGDTVNIASRLETMAPEDAIFISGEVLEALGDLASATHISESATLRGRSAPVEVYLLYGLRDQEGISAELDPAKLHSALARRPELHPISANDFTFHVCGSRGTRPVTGSKFAEFGGHTSCYVLKQGKRAVVIDCGSGLDDARPLLADCRVIDVVLTHVHYDHIIGLLGWGVFPREAQVSFYGDFASWLGKDTIDQFYRAPFWPIVPDLGEMVNIPRYGVPVKLPSGVTVTFYRADHPNDASLLYIQADNKRLCIMADCERSKGFPEALLKNCDLLLFDGMYSDEEYPHHVGWGHSTWQVGCRLAQEVTPSRLVITHHDPGRSDKDLRVMEAQAKILYPNTRFARSGDTWRL